MNGCDAFANTYQSLWGATVYRLDSKTLSTLVKVLNVKKGFVFCLFVLFVCQSLGCEISGFCQTKHNCEFYHSKIEK